jgi:hypothetical protein
MNFNIAMMKKNTLLLLPFLCLIFLSCNPPVPDSTMRFDFLDNFDKATKQPIDKVLRYKYNIGRDAMVIGVNAQISFKLTAEQTGDDLYFGLRFNLETNPDTARAECIIVVETSSQRDTVFSRLMDKAQNFADRNWSDEYVNMSRYKGQDITVRFSVLVVGIIDAWVDWSSPILVSDEK